MDTISSVINESMDSMFVDIEIKTGFKDLDELISFKRSNLYVFASRPAVGKTTLLINMAIKIAESGKDVYFFSLDLCKEEIMKMMASSYANLGRLKILTNDLNILERESLKEAFEKISNLPIHLDDSSRDSNYIINEIKKIKKGIVLIDGFEYLDVTDDDIGSYKMILNKTKFQVRCNNAYKLKRASIKSQLPIIVTCYVPRLPKGRECELKIKDLQRVGNIAMEADTVIFLEHMPNISVIKVNVQKLDRCIGDIGCAYLKHIFVGCRVEDCFPTETSLINFNEELRKNR